MPPRAAIAIGILLGLASCRRESPRAEPAPPVAPPPPPIPMAPNPVMLEGFYWNTPVATPDGSWWSHLRALAPDLAAAGITAVWIPPATKASPADDPGYAIYDRYDLGEFDQKGSIATRYGTLAELQSAIDSLHARRIQVYGDLVMNHVVGADRVERFAIDGRDYATWTAFDFPGRAGRYSAYRWRHDSFNGWERGPGSWIQWHPWDFAPYAAGDAYDALLGCELRYSDPRVRAETIAWGRWITAKLGLDGYRLDATKHVLTSFVNEWLDAVKTEGRFAVSEAWFGDRDALRAYARATGGRTALFDVPLHDRFAAMSDGDGGFDMRALDGAGLVATDGDLAVTFVDNHDTDQPGAALFKPVTRFGLHAYAYALLREKGYPCVFYKDLYERPIGPAIRALIALRAKHAFGPGIEYPQANDEDLYVYARAGDAAHAGLLAVLSDGAQARTKTLATPFKRARLVDATGSHAQAVVTEDDGAGAFPIAARSYAVWVPDQR